MAYQGKSPDSDWIQMNPRTTEPSFPATATEAYKEGTLFVSNETTATGAFYPPGLYVRITNPAGTAYSWQILTPNNNASQIDSGNLGSEFGGVPCGTIIPFAKDVSSTGLPTGYLLCDGSSVSQSSFATLYAVTGVAFGDGTTGTGAAGTGNFNIPDFRGRFLRGMTHGSTNDPDAGTRTADYTGGATGDNVGSYQADALAHHGHYTHNGTTSTAAKFSGVGLADGDYAIQGNNKNSDAYFMLEGNSTVPAYAKTAPATFPSGTFSAAGTDTRPKNIYVDYIIRYL